MNFRSKDEVLDDAIDMEVEGRFSDKIAEHREAIEKTAVSRQLCRVLQLPIPYWEQVLNDALSGDIGAINQLADKLRREYNAS
jgi:hypothetical protein